MTLQRLSPDPTTWRITAVAPAQERLVVHVAPLRHAVACPVCGTRSRRVPSRYRRQPWDVPWGRWPVQLVVQARRFCCDAPTCLRRIFVEPFPRLLARHARQTERLRQFLRELAQASGAEMAARLARWLGYLTSPDTRIRRQRAASLVRPSPRVLGVDEFALRRGVTSATLLVDLERHQPVAVLEGRTAEPLLKWLQAHPAVTVLARDRADAYALAGRQAAPAALQVADRFHLLRHVSEALKTLLHSRRWSPPTPVAPQEGAPCGAVPNTAEVPSHTPQPTPHKRAVWEAIQQHWGLGQSLRQIAQAVGRDRRTVRRYLAAEQPPVYPARRPRPTQLPPHLGYLAERWAQGCHNARRLYDELRVRGYHGSASMVRKVLQPWRARPADSSPRLSSPQLSRLILQPAERLREEERRTLAAVLQATPRLAQGYQLSTQFRTPLAEREVGGLEPWLQAVETSDLPSFQAVARSFRQDQDAITAALTTPWRTGPCEGQICRVKLITRLGYGRAKLDLLCQRILHRLAVPVQPIQQDHEVHEPAAA